MLLVASDVIVHLMQYLAYHHVYFDKCEEFSRCVYPPLSVSPADVGVSGVRTDYLIGLFHYLILTCELLLVRSISIVQGARRPAT